MLVSILFLFQNFFVVEDNNFRIQFFFCRLILLTIWILFVCLPGFFLFYFFAISLAYGTLFLCFIIIFFFCRFIQFSLFSFFFLPIFPAVQWSVFPTPSTSTSSSSYRCELNFLLSFPLLTSITFFLLRCKTKQNKKK